MKIKVYLEPFENGEPESGDRFFLGHAEMTELRQVVEVLNEVAISMDESEMDLTFEMIDFDKDVRFMLIDETVCVIRVNA